VVPLDSIVTVDVLKALNADIVVIGL
jgi:hypothetical protein